MTICSELNGSQAPSTFDRHAANPVLGGYHGDFEAISCGRGWKGRRCSAFMETGAGLRLVLQPGAVRSDLSSEVVIVMRREVWPALSIGAAVLTARAREQGGKLETSGLNGGQVVELLAAGLVGVERGVMVVIRQPPPPQSAS